MENLIFDEISKYIELILDTYQIRQQHIIDIIESKNTDVIIQITPSIFLIEIIGDTDNEKTISDTSGKANEDFESNMITILNHILNDYNLYLDNLDIQFNESAIQIVYSYTSSLSDVPQNESESHLSLQPLESVMYELLDSNYKDLKKLYSKLDNFMYIYKSDEFWRAKIRHDHDFDPPIGYTYKSLKEIYLYQNTVWSFGLNSRGQLGLGDTRKRNTPKKIKNIYAKSVSSGEKHTAIIDLNNEVWVFGNNKKGQLGLGDYSDRYSPKKMKGIFAKSISCGDNHTVLIDMNGEVWSFGTNDYGQLGLGDNIQRKLPTKIPGIIAKYVSCGARYTVLIDANNEVWSFGSNFYGQLGIGNHQIKKAPTQIYMPMSPNTTDDSSSIMRIGMRAKFVSCGEAHTVLIDMNNAVWSFGYNKFGQLGNDDLSYKNIPVKISELTAKFVACGKLHTLLIDMYDRILTFGENSYGQLGLGDYIDRKTPTLINKFTKNTHNETKICMDTSGSLTACVKSVSCGLYHTVIIDINNDVWSFGDNTDGQLGLGEINKTALKIALPTKIGKDAKSRSRGLTTAKHGSCGGNHTIIISGM